MSLGHTFSRINESSSLRDFYRGFYDIASVITLGLVPTARHLIREVKDAPVPSESDTMRSLADAHASGRHYVDLVATGTLLAVETAANTFLWYNILNRLAN